MAHRLRSNRGLPSGAPRESSGGRRPCEFCGANVPVWDIRVFRREGQAEPDFRLTVCDKCLPMVNERLSRSDKSDPSDKSDKPAPRTWESDRWEK